LRVGDHLDGAGLDALKGHAACSVDARFGIGADALKRHEDAEAEGNDKGKGLALAGGSHWVASGMGMGSVLHSQLL
jgi:hypothetical protein